MKKTLIFLVAAALILGGIYALLSTGVLEKKEERDDLSQNETSILSYDRPLTFMEIQGEETQTYEKEADEWICKEYPEYPLNNEELTLMGEFLSKLSAKRVLGEQNASFGLTEPSLKVLFRLSDGTEHTLLLGAKIPATGDYYAALSGTDLCFTVDGAGADMFYKTVFKHVLVYELPQIPLNNVVSVSVNGKKQTEYSDIISAVNSLYFSYCEEAFTEELSKYGLSPAKYEIEVVYTEQGAERRFTLYVGNKGKDNYTYAAAGDYPNTVYCCFDMAAERLLAALEGK